jgi:hypothetical protein
LEDVDVADEVEVRVEELEDEGAVVVEVGAEDKVELVAEDTLVDELDVLGAVVTDEV